MNKWLTEFHIWSLRWIPKLLMQKRDRSPTIILRTISLIKEQCSISWKPTVQRQTCIDRWRNAKKKWWTRGLLCNTPKWLWLNDINTVAWECPQTSSYDGEKRVWNWEMFVFCHVKYHITFENLKAYECQGFDSMAFGVTCCQIQLQW